MANTKICSNFSFRSILSIRDWSFSNDDGDGNENVKKRNCSYLSKTTTFYAHHTFLYISLSSLQDDDVKVLNLNLLIFVSFPKLGCVPQEINSWKILLHLTFSANWNKCKKFWKNANSFYKWRLLLPSPSFIVKLHIDSRNRNLAGKFRAATEEYHALKRVVCCKHKTFSLHWWESVFGGYFSLIINCKSLL